MIKINVQWILSFVGSMDSILEAKVDLDTSEILLSIIKFRSNIHGIMADRIFGPYIVVSRNAGYDVIRVIDDLINKNQSDILNVKYQDLSESLAAIGKFKFIFSSEIAVFPLFMISSKAGYDVSALVANGAVLFPEALNRKVPEAAIDAAEVGKALAFELATACGFHAFRVLEAVFRRYWDHVSGGLARPHPETLGKIASEMVDKKIGDERVVTSIQQMTKLHRNPLIHPDVNLGVEEAIGIIGMARSVMAPMLVALPEICVPGPPFLLFGSREDAAAEPRG